MTTCARSALQSTLFLPELTSLLIATVAVDNSVHTDKLLRRYCEYPVGRNRQVLGKTREPVRFLLSRFRDNFIRTVVVSSETGFLLTTFNGLPFQSDHVAVIINQLCGRIPSNFFAHSRSLMRGDNAALNNLRSGHRVDTRVIANRITSNWVGLPLPSFSDVNLSPYSHHTVPRRSYCLLYHIALPR